MRITAIVLSLIAGLIGLVSGLVVFINMSNISAVANSENLPLPPEIISSVNEPTLILLLLSVCIIIASCCIYKLPLVAGIVLILLSFCYMPIGFGWVLLLPAGIFALFGISERNQDNLYAKRPKICK